MKQEQLSTFAQGERREKSAEPNIVGYISPGIFANALLTRKKVNPTFIASDAADRPYNKTTKFLLDLYHEKNLCESKASIAVAAT